MKMMIWIRLMCQKKIPCWQNAPNAIRNVDESVALCLRLFLWNSSDTLINMLMIMVNTIKVIQTLISNDFKSSSRQILISCVVRKKKKDLNE